MTDPLLAGDLLLVYRAAGVIGWLICFGQRVRYTGWAASLRWARKFIFARAGYDPNDPLDGHHIAVYVGDGLIIEALARGLTMSRLGDKYHPEDYDVLRLAVANPYAGAVARAAAVAFARAELDRKAKYSWASIASIVLSLLTPLRLDVSWGGAMICSAFGARCWEHAGVVLPTLSPATTMPADLGWAVRGISFPKAS